MTSSSDGCGSTVDVQFCTFRVSTAINVHVRLSATWVSMIVLCSQISLKRSSCVELSQQDDREPAGQATSSTSTSDLSPEMGVRNFTASGVSLRNISNKCLIANRSTVPVAWEGTLHER